MHALRTAVLEHTTDHGVHHDWLIEDPALPDPHAPGARLWTARVPAPPCDWPRCMRLELEVIPPHRRAYLDYQGPISGGRGRVRRVAAGLCTPLLWTGGRILIGTNLVHGNAHIELRQLAGGRWIGLCYPQAPRR